MRSQSVQKRRWTRTSTLLCVVAAALALAAGCEKAAPSARDTEAVQMYKALRGDDIEQVKALLANGYDVDRGLPDGRTPLQQAAQMGGTEIAELLLARGADIEANAGGQTPLSTAATYGRRDTVELLLTRGARVNVRDHHDMTPLHCALACYAEDADDIACLLIARGAEIDAADPWGRTPLFYAAECGHLQAASMLLESGANVNIKCVPIDGKQPWQPLYDRYIAESTLHCAAYEGHVEVVRLLLSHGAKINERSGRSNTTPLHEASEQGYLETMALLLASGADVNAQDDIGQTPLHRAALRGNVEAAELLLAHGADANITDAQGRTASSAAAHANQGDIVEMLQAAEAEGAS